MLKFDRKKKKLVIPVGINPSFGNDASTNYNTTDADVVANDILEGKIAYGSEGKIVGTLDIESEIATSFENGYAAGQEYGYESGYGVGREEGFDAGIEDQKAKLETITITENGTYNREDGYNEVIVEVPDLNGDYNEGYNQGYSEGYGAGESAGIEEGKQEIISGMDDATITPSTVIKGEIGYGKNNEKIIGEFEYVEGFNFGKIGYSQELSNELNSDTAEKLAYSKQLYDAWDPNRTSAQSYFQNNTSLVYAPLFNTSNVTNMNSMFKGCSNLTTVPEFDTSNVTDMKGMFNYCSSLTTIPLLDTSKVTNMHDMFSYCLNLTTLPLLDTSNVTDMGYMFAEDKALSSVPLLNTSKVTDVYGMFQRCSNLSSVPLLDMSSVPNVGYMFYYCSNLTNLDGFTNLGAGFTGTSSNHNLTFSYTSKLTKQSCLNIFNTIYDMTNTSVTDAKITLHATTKALLSADDIAIATSKGWTIQ